jgi:hypothetical protein
MCRYPQTYPQPKIRGTQRNSTDAKKPLSFSGLRISVAFSRTHWKIAGGADGTRTRGSIRRISKLLIHLRCRPLHSPSIPGFASKFARSRMLTAAPTSQQNAWTHHDAHQHQPRATSCLNLQRSLARRQRRGSTGPSSPSWAQLRVSFEISMRSHVHRKTISAYLCDIRGNLSDRSP